MEVARQLGEVAAELDQVARQLQGVENSVRFALGSTATGADKRMFSSLNRVGGSTRQAQQALSAAANALRKPV